MCCVPSASLHRGNSTLPLVLGTNLNARELRHVWVHNVSNKGRQEKRFSHDQPGTQRARP